VAGWVPGSLAENRPCLLSSSLTSPYYRMQCIGFPDVNIGFSLESFKLVADPPDEPQPATRTAAAAAVVALK
jgi:hypothetical protein